MSVELFEPPRAKSRRPDADGQSPLFPWVNCPRSTPQSDAAAIVESPTSRAAGKRIAPNARVLRDRLIEHFKTVGRWGATDEEGMRALGIEGNSYRPRRVELVRLGLIQATARTRPTKSGNVARVYCVAGDQP